MTTVSSMHKVSVRGQRSRSQRSKPHLTDSGRNSSLNLHMMHKAWCSLPWRHNGRDSVSNHQPHDCLLNRLFRRRSKKTSKVGVTGLCAGNSPGTGEFLAQMASYAENVSIWWRHHVLRRDALLFSKATHQISRSHSYKKSSIFRTATPAWIHQWLRNNAQSLK